MGTAVERALKRLQVVAATPDAPRLRTLDKIVKDAAATAAVPAEIPVEADGSPWGKFLSFMNKAIRPYMDDINQAMDAQDLETLPEILSDAMQDLLDALADEFGYDTESEGDEGGEYEDGEADDAQFDEAPAAGPEGGTPTTIIE